LRSIAASTQSLRNRKKASDAGLCSVGPTESYVPTPVFERLHAPVFVNVQESAFADAVPSIWTTQLAAWAFPVRVIRTVFALGVLVAMLVRYFPVGRVQPVGK